MSSTMQVRERGALTLPAELRRRYNIQTGDAFQLVDLDGIFILTPMAAIVPELAREIERGRLEAGLSVDDMLKALREERVRYTTEKYGDPTTTRLNATGTERHRRQLATPQRVRCTNRTSRSVSTHRPRMYGLSCSRALPQA